MTRCLVTGGRRYYDEARVYKILDAAVERLGLDVLIEGGATGADELARQWAIERGIEHHRVDADWSDLSHSDAVIRVRRDGVGYDAKAGGRRNQRMLDEFHPDFVVAFPGGDGTKDMKRRARQAGVRVIEIEEALK